MKKWILLIGSILLIGLLTACGGDTNDDNSINNTSEQTEQADNTSDNRNANNSGSQGNQDNQDDENVDDGQSNTNNNSNNSDMQTKMDKLDYEEIEIEVKYGDEEYEIELKQDEGERIKAEIEDEINDEFIEGEEAFNKLYPLVNNLSIDQDTSKEDAIQDILNTFDLEQDYDEFELEITFKDQTELEYEDK